MMALAKAMPSPMRICIWLLCGKFPRFSSLLPDRSTELMSTMPARDASTPASLRIVNPSTLIRAQKISVHTDDVDVRMVTLPTDV